MGSHQWLPAAGLFARWVAPSGAGLSRSLYDGSVARSRWQFISIDCSFQFLAEERHVSKKKKNVKEGKTGKKEACFQVVIPILEGLASLALYITP